MDREKILKEREIYYSNTFVLFELIKGLQHKELCFLTDKNFPDEKKRSIRYLNAWDINYLKKHFNWFNFLKNTLNMYHSVSYLDKIPIFSYNLKLRSKEDKYIDFNKNYEDHMIGYDLFIDFDGKEDFNKCYKESKEFKEILEQYKIPYYLLNSSFNGFHFVISSRYSSNSNIKDLIKKIYDVIYNIKGIYSFDTLDNSIIDSKRVKKLPYSYVCDGSIALPLTDTQFMNFRKEIVTVDYVLKNNFIKNRGYLIRNYGLSQEELIKNVNKFFIDFS